MPRGDQRFQGVVLAAGFGSRLRPLTDSVPKPLIPFLGSTPLELALWQMQNAGIDRVAINSHHLSQQIADFVQRNPFKQELKLSYEESILGTGGVYNPLRAWQGDTHLVVINGDVISDIDLQAIMKHHANEHAVASMVLLPTVIPGQSGVHFIDSKNGGLIQAIGKEAPSGTRAGNFACVQILSPEFINLLPPKGFFDIIQSGYQVALQQKLKLTCLTHHGVWHDLGNPQAYWQAVKDFLDDPQTRKRAGLEACLSHRARAPHFLPGPSYVSERSAVDKSAHLGSYSVIEDDCSISANAAISNALLWPRTQIAQNAKIQDQIIGPQCGISLRV